MTQDEIIEMVMQISGCDRPEDDSPALKMFVAFAKLVAAKAFEEGFFAGFAASGEGFNGEYPYGDKGIDIKTDQWVLSELKEVRGEA